MIANTPTDAPEGQSALLALPVPVSDTVLEMQEFKARMAAQPQSLNPAALPQALRDNILKALGERGDNAGLIPTIFSQLRKGSLRFDRDEDEKKKEYLRRLMAMMAGYMSLYFEVAEKVAIAEIQVEHMIKTLDEGIALFSRGRKNGFDPAANPKHIIPQATKNKKEMEDFRDNELQKFRRRLESNDLPSEKELVDMSAAIDQKMTRFQKFRRALARKLIDVGEYGFEIIAGLSAVPLMAIKDSIRRSQQTSASQAPPVYSYTPPPVIPTPVTPAPITPVTFTPSVQKQAMPLGPLPVEAGKLATPGQNTNPDEKPIVKTE